MNKQRFQKLAGLLNEDISYKEALRDVDAVKTIVDGKRGVAFVTERGTGPQDWKVVQALIADNGLKAMHVKGNEHNAYVVYAQGHEKDATELKDIAEKYGGYLAYNATEEDSRRIGQLLKYKPEEIEDYIIHNRTQRMDEIVVKSTDPVSWEAFRKACIKELSKSIDIKDKQYLYNPGDRGMSDEYIGEFDNGRVLVDWYIDECIEYYQDGIEDMLGQFGSDDVRDLAEKSIFYGGMDEGNLILSINDEDVYYIIGYAEEDDEGEDYDDEELDEIIVKPTQKPGGIYIDDREVNTSSIDVDGIDPSDYPDYADAYASYAEFEDGEALTDEQLETLNDQYYDVVYDKIFDMLHEIVVKPAKGPKYRVDEVVKVKGIHQNNVFTVTQVYESGNDCYTHKPMTMYLVGYNTIKKGKTDYTSRIPPEIMDQYWYSIEPTMEDTLTVGEFTVPEEYLQKVPSVSRDAELNEIVVKPTKVIPKDYLDHGFWNEKDLQRKAPEVKINWDFSNYHDAPIIKGNGNGLDDNNSDYYEFRGIDQYGRHWLGYIATHDEDSKLVDIVRDLDADEEDLEEIVVKPSSANTWEGFKKLCVNRMAQFINLRDEYSIWEIGSMGTQDMMGYSDGYGALNHYITACQEEYESVDELIRYFEDSNAKEYTAKSLVNDLIYTTGLNDFLQLDLNEHEALWLKPRLDEIVVKSSKKDQDYWESEDDLPKDIKVDWDWDDVYYESEENEEGDEVYFGSVHGIDQYGDMYDAEFSSRISDFEDNAWVYSIKRVGNINDDTLEEIVVKPVVGRTSWKYEKDLPESIKITWDYDTMTIDDVYTPSNEAEGWIEGYDEAGTHYAGIWYGWVQYDDPNEVEGISYIGDISKLRDESINEIVVKSTKAPIRYGNLYTLRPEDFPQQNMTWKEAHDYLEKLGPDWRLPTLAEIVYIHKQKGLPRTLEYYWTTDLYKKSRKGPDAAKAVPLLGGEHPEQSLNITARQHSKSFGYSGSGWDDGYRVCPVKTVKPNKLAEILGMDEIVVKPTSQPVRYGNLYALKPENLPSAMKRPDFESYLKKLGPGWRLPTFNELYNIYSKGGLPRDFHFFLTTNPYVFKGGNINPEVLATYNLGGTPGEEKQSDVFSSAFFDGETVEIFPVKDVSTTEEEPSKLADILGINKN